MQAKAIFFFIIQAVKDSPYSTEEHRGPEFVKFPDRLVTWITVIRPIRKSVAANRGKALHRGALSHNGDTLTRCFN